MDTFLGFVIIIAVIAGGIWLANRSSKKRMAQEWDGTVLKKWISTYTDEDGDTTETPTIQVQIDGGKKKKMTVSAQTYNALNAGDKVKKSAGQKDPAKV
ncbi:MAG TPA: hypothetical protein VHD60_04075 [Candidatus Saccharimonadales bacterium]|nr:hypothetical protein [Candidatus Saccharimonadales bacterium]